MSAFLESIKGELLQYVIENPVIIDILDDLCKNTKNNQLALSAVLGILEGMKKENFLPLLLDPENHLKILIENPDLEKLYDEEMKNLKTSEGIILRMFIEATVEIFLGYFPEDKKQTKKSIGLLLGIISEEKK